MARLGTITRQPCLTDPPPPDPRCADEVFRLTHGDICPNIPSLVVTPAFALVCNLASIQFKAIYIDETFTETDVTDQAVFISGDADIAAIGAATGNATGLSPGEAAISATYNGLTGFSTLTVLGDDCCADRTVAMMVMVDISKSMNQPLDSVYQTKLHFARAAASRFISEVNQTKDLIGLMTFTGTTVNVLSSPIADKAAVLAEVAGIGQTNHTTKFYSALTTAIEELNEVTADSKVLVLISDGQDKDDSYSTDDNPITLLDEFKSAGGIVMCVGVRAYGFGYKLLNEFATGGFFLNAYKATADTVSGPLPDVPAQVLDWMSGLKGYICAGNCLPDGDTYQATGALNYCDFENWQVLSGHVDLVGNGFMDMLPGNGLYVDLAGSMEEFSGLLESRVSFALFAGQPYRISFKLAGNQRVDAAPNTVRVQLVGRNDPEIPNQIITAPITIVGGATFAPLETYEYAVSYANEHGETELTPAVARTNGGFAGFIITVTPDTIVAPTTLPSVVKLWKRKQGTTKWYKIAEGANGAVFTDSMNHAALVAAVEAGTVDACQIPFETNTTDIPTVIFEKDVTIDAFQQGFTQQTFEFTPGQNTAAWLRIQQIATPDGHEAVGLLLDEVVVYDVGSEVTLLTDNFDGENLQYVPPKCGTGEYFVPTADPTDVLLISGAGDAAANGTYTVDGTGWRKNADYRIAFSPGIFELLGPGDSLKYECFEADFPAGPWADTGGGAPEPTGAYATIQNYGYISNYDGCYGVGCLDEPPPAQKQDPTPLTDNETLSPPKNFNATAQRSGSCEAGKLYVPSSPLIVESMSVTACPVAGFDILNGLHAEMQAIIGENGSAGTSPDPPDQIATLRGDPTKTYNVTFRIRGVVPPVQFLNTRMYDLQNSYRRYFHYLDDGYPSLHPFNVSDPCWLWTSDPNQWYALNATPHAGAFISSATYGDGSANEPWCHPMDYQVTIPIAGNATVMLRMRNRDGLSLSNVGTYIVFGFSYDDVVPFNTQANLSVVTYLNTNQLARYIIRDVTNDMDLAPSEQINNRNEWIHLDVIAIVEI